MPDENLSSRLSCLVFAAAVLGTQVSTAGTASAAPATVEIAAPADALTLARVNIDGTPKLISVSSYEEGAVSGVVLTGAPDDPITAFSGSGV